MKKLVLVILSVFFVFGAMALVIWGKLADGNLKSIITGVKYLNTDEKNKYANEDIINILVFGIDRRTPSAASRSDSIMILTLDMKNERVKAASLMRDMYVSIPGKKNNKLNAAYAFGGPELAVKTINSDFGLDIKDYITADFFGFPKIIDSLGGVEINVKPGEAASCGVKNPGQQALNGNQALAYCRLREVGNADFERTQRQRRVINEIYKKLKGMNIKELEKFAGETVPNVETSLNPKEISYIASQMVNFNVQNIDELRIPAYGKFKNENINGASCLVPDLEENKILLHNFIYGENKPGA